jgi:hypothetical protein
MIGKYCIVRGKSSGVFAGTVKEIEGQQVLMEDVRRIWYWDGAASISQLAKSGTVAPNNCKFTVRVDSVLILDAIEIIPCTEKAVQSIEAVKEWKR